MKKYLGLSLLAILVLLGASCETPKISTEPHKSRAEITLEKDGFTDIKLTGTPLFSCGKDDSILNSSEFTATKNGQQIDGTVCCGWLKGCTIRY